MSFQAWLLFIFIVVLYLSSFVSATSSEHFSDDLSQPNRLDHKTDARSSGNPTSSSGRSVDELMELEDRKLNEKTFLNEFAIELDASSCRADPQVTNCKEHLDKKAEEIAGKHGFVNHGQVSFRLKLILKSFEYLSISESYPSICESSWI